MKGTPKRVQGLEHLLRDIGVHQGYIAVHASIAMAWGI